MLKVFDDQRCLFYKSCQSASFFRFFKNVFQNLPEVSLFLKSAPKVFKKRKNSGKATSDELTPLQGSIIKINSCERFP